MGTMTRGISEQFWSHCSCFVTSSFAVSMEIWSRDRPDFLSSEEQTVETGKDRKIRLEVDGVGLDRIIRRLTMFRSSHIVFLLF